MYILSCNPNRAFEITNEATGPPERGATITKTMPLTQIFQLLGTPHNQSEEKTYPLPWNT